MNEFEIRRALAGATPVSPGTPDPERLRTALRRADRIRNVRAAMTVGAVSLIASVGLFMTRAGESTSPLDVVDGPEVPTPDIAPPILDASTETTTIPPSTTSPSTSSTTTPPPPAAEPSHLDSAVTTTAPPALITVTTTIAPTTSTTPPATTTSTAAPPTTTTAATSGFTASALYGSCEEPIPYDEYSGTAAPGATITVSSPWSATAEVTADGNGDWWIRIEFPSAPVGEHFAVDVTDGTTSSRLDFVRTA